APAMETLGSLRTCRSVETVTTRPQTATRRPLAPRTEQIQDSATYSRFTYPTPAQQGDNERHDQAPFLCLLTSLPHRNPHRRRATQGAVPLPQRDVPSANVRATSVGVPPCRKQHLRERTKSRTTPLSSGGRAESLELREATIAAAVCCSGWFGQAADL